MVGLKKGFSSLGSGNVVVLILLLRWQYPCVAFRYIYIYIYKYIYIYSYYSYISFGVRTLFKGGGGKRVEVFGWAFLKESILS